jgi:hypothetical protein
MALKPPYSSILAYNLPVCGQRSEDVDQEGVMSMDSQRHEMQLATTHASGAEEWFCPTCGRRFLLQWPPLYRKIILEPGDEIAIHSCSKGGLRIGQLTITQEATSDPLEGLGPWMQWLTSADLDKLAE